MIDGFEGGNGPRGQSGPMLGLWVGIGNPKSRNLFSSSLFATRDSALYTGRCFSPQAAALPLHDDGMFIFRKEASRRWPETTALVVSAFTNFKTKSQVFFAYKASTNIGHQVIQSNEYQKFAPGLFFSSSGPSDTCKAARYLC